MASDRVSKPDTKSSGGDYLKVGMVGKMGKKATITLTGSGEEKKGTYGPQVTIGCKYKGKDYLWSFGQNSGNHKRLYDRFGAKFSKWKGSVKVEVKEFNGNDYLAVVD